MKSRLRTSLETPVAVGRFEPTTLVILRKGLGLSHEEAVGLDRPELKPPEREAAAWVLGSNPYIGISFPR